MQGCGKATTLRELRYSRLQKTATAIIARLGLAGVFSVGSATLTRIAKPGLLVSELGLVALHGLGGRRALPRRPRLRESVAGLRAVRELGSQAHVVGCINESTKEPSETKSKSSSEEPTKESE